MLEKTLECPLDCKEIKPVKPKRNQSWIFIGRTDSDIEAPMFWPPDANNWLIIKDPEAGKDWKEKKGMTQDEMVEWHHRLKGHEFEQALGDGEGWGSLACCSPWCCKKSDMTEQLNNNNKEACVSFLILWTGDRKKPGSCSDGQGLALKSFNPISADGCCTPSVVIVWPEDPALGSMGSW